MATVVIVALGMLLHPKEVRRPPGAVVGILMLFIIWMTITTAFAIVASVGNIYSGLWYPFAFTALSVVTCFFLLPETRNRSLDD